jgi:hypothetical protein
LTAAAPETFWSVCGAIPRFTAPLWCNKIAMKANRRCRGSSFDIAQAVTHAKKTAHLNLRFSL